VTWTTGEQMGESGTGDEQFAWWTTARSAHHMVNTTFFLMLQRTSKYHINKTLVVLSAKRPTSGYHWTCHNRVDRKFSMDDEGGRVE
jgi:hypothetical protein